MAKFNSTTFGKISGKFGDVIAVVMSNGVNYLKAANQKQYDPKTPKQLVHRARISLTSKSLAPFNPIFKELLGTTNGISIARSYAFKNAIVGEYPELSMDYEKLMFTFGKLQKLDNASVAINDKVVTVNWNFDESFNFGDDAVSIIVFNKDTEQTIHLFDVASRSDKTATIEVNETWAESTLYFWTYVMSGDEVSDSEFLGRG